jgi:hypothetical protein
MKAVLVGVALVTSLAAQKAEANSCNLYRAQQFGQLREGCSITIFNLPDVSPDIPTITRNGQELTPTIVQDQITLKVAYAHYPSPDSCSLLPTEYENETFDRYVVTWDLKGGDELIVGNYPTTFVVPGPGECGSVEPAFYCTDPIQGCYDPSNPTPDPDDDDLGGCSAASGSTSWLAILAVLGVLSYSRRSRTSSRR